METWLPSSLDLGSLSVVDAARLCRAYWEELATTLPPEREASVSCEHFAIAQSSSYDVITGLITHDRALCEQHVDECVYSRATPEPSPAERCDGQRVHSVVADCEATVADYERCATGVLDEIDGRARVLTCDAYGDGSEGGVQVLEQIDEARERTKQACSGLQRACPWLAVVSDGGLIRVQQSESTATGPTPRRPATPCRERPGAGPPTRPPR